MDHQTWLGDSLAGIAREKAGIIKPGRPVISGCRGTEVRRIIRRKAAEAAAPLTEIDQDCDIQIMGSRRGRYQFDLKTCNRTYRRLRLSLAGRYQVRNAALAISAVDSLDDISLPVNKVRTALSSTNWPGRMDEYLSTRRTLLEGGHNPEGARELSLYLREHEVDEIHLVFGVMLDKDVRKMGSQLFPQSRSIHLCPVQNTRTANPSVIAAMHARFRTRIRIHGSARSALRAAWRECSKNGLVVVTGSIYLLGELLPYIRKGMKK